MTSVNEALRGLVLVGGKSSRMKQAKAYLTVNGMPQWQYCERVLNTVCQDVYFSVSPQLYPPLNVALARVIDDVFNEPIGPLGGIISAFRRFGEQALLVLACDLPYFDEQAARMLCARRNPQKLATVFAHSDGIEPLCAIYEPAIKQELAKAWANGTYCPRAIVSKLDIERITDFDERWIHNINHAHELASLTKNLERTVSVRYYAALRERAGRAEEVVSTSAKTMGELYAVLKQRYSFSHEINDLRFSCNNKIVEHETKLGDHDDVVFIPPVSGG